MRSRRSCESRRASVLGRQVSSQARSVSRSHGFRCQRRRTRLREAQRSGNRALVIPSTYAAPSGWRSSNRRSENLDRARSFAENSDPRGGNVRRQCEGERSASADTCGAGFSKPAGRRRNRHWREGHEPSWPDSGAAMPMRAGDSRADIRRVRLVSDGSVCRSPVTYCASASRADKLVNVAGPDLLRRSHGRRGPGRRPS